MNVAPDAMPMEMAAVIPRFCASEGHSAQSAALIRPNPAMHVLHSRPSYLIVKTPSQATHGHAGSGLLAIVPRRALLGRMALSISCILRHSHACKLRLACIELQALRCHALVAFRSRLASLRLPKGFAWEENASSWAVSPLDARKALAALLTTGKNIGVVRAQLALVYTHMPLRSA